MNQHQQDINRIHQSEIYGAAIFRTVAKLCLKKSRKKKWQKLYELEVQTLKALQEFNKITKQKTNASYLWHLKGVFEGLVLALLPWKVSMHLLEKGTLDFQIIFLRLKENSNPKHIKFYSYVYAHEKAIESFAQIEQVNGKNSLKKVLGLLNTQFSFGLNNP